MRAAPRRAARASRHPPITTTTPTLRTLTHPLARPAAGKKIHRTLVNDFKYAWVWGSSVKHNPGRVGKSHVLQDEDVVQIVKKI